MAPGGLILAMALTAGAPGHGPPLAFKHEATTTRPVVMLGDVADLSPLPGALKANAASLPVARFAAGQDRMQLTTRRLAERVRATLPALAPWLADPAESEISVRFDRIGAGAPAIAARTQPCLRVTRPVASGGFPVRADFEPTNCAAATARMSFRYDVPAGAARAARDLALGETVAAAGLALADVRPGQKLYVHANIGAVAIRREVQAMQPARPGQAIFVRTLDGSIFPVALTDIEP